jgi:hypothetical protein
MKPDLRTEQLIPKLGNGRFGVAVLEKMNAE